MSKSSNSGNSKKKKSETSLLGAASRTEGQIWLEHGIALIERGGCSFYTKCLLAQEAGAVGCLIFNCESGVGVCPSYDSSRPVVYGTLGPQGLELGIPCFGISRELGLTLAATRGVQIHMAVHSR